MHLDQRRELAGIAEIVGIGIHAGRPNSDDGHASLAKSDRLDAHVVAKLVRDESTTLPRVPAVDEAAVLDLLVTEREVALSEATRLRNQLHQQLLQLDPTYASQLSSLTTKAGLEAAASYTHAQPAPVQQQRITAICRLVQRLRLTMEQAAVLASEICKHVEARYLPLTELNGIKLLTAAALAGILGPGQRFTSEAQLAAYAGVAPLETSSAGTVRHRLNRGGNRRLNAILYRIALTRARSWPPAQAYLARRQADGETWREAIRALKRYLIRAIWRLWQRCLSQPGQPMLQQAA